MPVSAQFHLPGLIGKSLELKSLKSIAADSLFLGRGGGSLGEREQSFPHCKSGKADRFAGLFPV